MTMLHDASAGSTTDVAPGTERHDDDAKLALIRDVGFARYFKADRWRDYNRQFFDGLAEKYDATNDLHSFGTKRRFDRVAVDRLPVAKGARILDLCTGTCGHRDPSREEAPRRAHRRGRRLGAHARGGAAQGGRLRGPHRVPGSATRSRSTFPTVTSMAPSSASDFATSSRSKAACASCAASSGPAASSAASIRGSPGTRSSGIAYEAHFKRIAPILGKLVFHIGEFNSFRYLPESQPLLPRPRPACRHLPRTRLPRRR
jgi:hypothetical protein